jgi:hypothetical protein
LTLAEIAKLKVGSSSGRFGLATVGDVEVKSVFKITAQPGESR